MQESRLGTELPAGKDINLIEVSSSKVDCRERNEDTAPQYD